MVMTQVGFPVLSRTSSTAELTRFAVFLVVRLGSPQSLSMQRWCTPCS